MTPTELDEAFTWFDKASGVQVWVQPDETRKTNTRDDAIDARTKQAGTYIEAVGLRAFFFFLLFFFFFLGMVCMSERR